MEVAQIASDLRRVFERECCRIVFWDDPEADFKEAWPDLALEGVQIINLCDISALEVKVHLELEDAASKYLLYSAAEVSRHSEDWLRDIRLYSQSFRADRASMILRDLGLSGPNVREHIKRCFKFCASKDRRARLKHFVESSDTESDLDRKMLAVACKSDRAEAFSIVRMLMHSMASVEGLDLVGVPPAWEQIERFGLDSAFWELMRRHFGYAAEEPRFADLVSRMLVSDFGHHLTGTLPVELHGLQLPPSGTQNAVVFLAQWRDRSSKASSYNWWAEQVCGLLQMNDRLRGYELEDVLGITTFAGVDTFVVEELVQRLRAGSSADAVERIIDHRRPCHWVSSDSVPDERRKARSSVYEALAAAAHLLELRRTYESGFESGDATSLYKQYETELFRFDQLYRHFCVHADVAAARGIDLLKPLRTEIEQCYANWYLTNIALAWNQHVDTCLPERWECGRAPHQYRFFLDNVQPWLRSSPNRRAFVIVSDALRYEVAEELMRALNLAPSLNAELTSQLGVLPSYTALGMASLLPHRKLSYTANGEVLLDGKPSASLVQRSEILGCVDGLAIRAEELLALGREPARKRVSDVRILYVYHNEIDATGDSANTESHAFEAAGRAIEDLERLVKYLVNTLNANYVVITADHGFLFTYSAPELPDKSRIDRRPDGTVVAKKRYLLGQDLPEFEHAWRGETKVTARASGGMKFWIPKGNNRFHFSGGARFVHGGAMLQEVVVPIIKVRRKAGKKNGGKAHRQVEVQVMGTRHRITTPRHRFNLLQMEPVNQSTREVTLKIAVYEEEQPVTDIQTVTFSSTSRNMEERQKSVVLTLRDQPYSKRTSYRLVLRNALTGIRHEIPVIVDRAFSDDF